MNAAFAASTAAMAGPGNLLITAIGAVPRTPSDAARTGPSGPVLPAPATAAAASTAAITIGPIGLR